MSAQHDPSHRARLIEVLESGRALGETELAACASCVEEHERLTRTAAVLDRIGDEEREALQASAELADPLREERLARRFAAALAGPALPVPAPMPSAPPLEPRRVPLVPTPPLRRKGSRRMLLLAALLLVSVWAAWPRSQPPARPDPRLGSSPASLAPSGEGADFARFHWDVPLPSGGWFVVHVCPPDLAGGELDASGIVRGQEWRPEPERWRAWGERIHWWLERYDGTDGAPRIVGEADAWLDSSR